MGAFATPRVSTAYADTLSNTEPVQIAQSDEEKPKEGEDEDDLGEDDC